MPVVNPGLTLIVRPTEEDADALLQLERNLLILSTEEDPEKALEAAEKIMRLNGGIKATAGSRMWYVLLNIIKPLGLWKHKRVLDQGSGLMVQQYSSFEEYAQITMQEIDKVSASTVDKRSALFGKLVALDLDKEDILEQLEHPSQAEEKLKVMEFDPSADGGYEFVGLVKEARDGVREQIGWTPNEDSDDKMVARDYMRADHDSAKKAVAKAFGVWMDTVAYVEDAGQHFIEITSWNPSGPGRESVRFVAERSFKPEETPHLKQKLASMRSWGRQDNKARELAKKRGG